MELNHGGDWARFRNRYGTMPLDFSASTTPLPMPEGIKKAIIRSLDQADCYPDPLCRELTAALGKRHSLPPEYILCGAGAADLLFRLVLTRRPRQALIVEPTFSGYEEVLTSSDCHIDRFFLREEGGFVLTAELLSCITPGLDMLFLCNPNNPTGQTVDCSLLHEILTQCAKTGTFLVLDECFNDFLDDPKEHSLISEVERFPHLLILRSFTKWYPLAGLRLGYAICSDTTLLERMRRWGQPWPVSSAAQAAGFAALEEAGYSAALAPLIREQRLLLTSGLAGLGCKVIPSEANFLLFRRQDSGLDRKLEKRGILIRNCAKFPGLGPGWYRTAIRTETENQTLLRTMKEVL